MTFAIGEEVTSQSLEAYNHASPPSNKRQVATAMPRRM